MLYFERYLELVLIVLLCRSSVTEGGGVVGKVMSVRFYTRNGTSLSYTDVKSLDYNFLSVRLKHEYRVGHTLLLLLTKEKAFMSDNYEESVVTKFNTIKLDPNKAQKDCYYSGQLYQQNDSLAIINVCNGFSGRILGSGKEYLVNPFDASDDSNVKVTVVRVSSPDEDFHCPVDTNFSRVVDHDSQGTPYFFQSGRHKREERKNIYDRMDGNPPIIQLFVTVASDMFNTYRNVEKVTQSVKEVILATSKHFNKAGIFLALIKLEIWETNPFRIPSGQSTGDFYRKANKLYRSYILPRKDVPAYDAWILIVRQTLGPKKGVLGLAPLGLMCNTWNGAVFIRYSESLDRTSVILAHELGHMINLAHLEDSHCKSCSEDNCIMSGDFAAESGTKWAWDDCSLERLKHDLPKYFCLFNDARQKTSICGDGIIDEDETCDCGNLPPETCNQDCCQECHLTNMAQCASGLCCDLAYCMFRPSFDVCGKSKGECDEEDKCDGLQAICVDRKKQDGTMCTDRFFCYKGICVTHDLNCEKIWGDNSRSGIDLCYDKNLRGDLQGHCFKPPSSNKATPCSDEDKFCGLLQCNVGPDRFPKRNLRYPEFSFIDDFYHTQHDGNYCSVAISSSLEVQNLCYAPDGVKCGTNKMCFRRKCVDRAWFIYNQHLKFDESKSQNLCLRIHVLFASITLRMLLDPEND